MADKNEITLKMGSSSHTELAFEMAKFTMQNSGYVPNSLQHSAEQLSALYEMYYQQIRGADAAATKQRLDALNKL